MQTEQIAKKLNDPSFRAKRGISLFCWQKMPEGFLASLGMTAWDFFSQPVKA
jgi:hypothetical protein